MKNQLKCKRMITIQQHIYQIFCIIRIMNLLVQIYQDRQIEIFLNKLIFLGKLEDDGAALFLIAEKQLKTVLDFSLDPLIVTE